MSQYSRLHCPYNIYMDNFGMKNVEALLKYILFIEYMYIKEL